MTYEEWKKGLATRQQPTSAYERWRANLILDDKQPAPTIEGGGISTFGREFGKGILRGFMNVGKGIIGTTEWIIPGKQESLLEAKERIKSAIQRVPMTREGAAAWGGRILGEALPYTGSTLIGGYAGAALKAGKAVSLAAAGLVGFSTMGDNAYDEAKSRGATEGQAQAERVIVGTINAAIEMSQIDRLMKFHSAGRHSLQNFIRLARTKAWRKLAGKELKGFGADALKVAIQEAAEEFAQEGVSIAVPWAIRGDVPRTESGQVDFMAIGQRMGESGLGGGFAGLVLGGAGAIGGAGVYAAAPTEVEIQNLAETIRNSKLNEVEKTLMLREVETVREEEGDLLVSEEQIPLERLRDDMDAIVEPLELMRPLEEAEIAKESARRWEEYKNIADDVDNPRLKAKIARQALKGQKKFDIPPLESYLTEDKVTLAYATIWDSTQLNQGEKDTGSDALDKLFVQGQIPAIHELKVLKRVGVLSEKTVTKLLQKPKSVTQKAWTVVKDLTLAPWSILTAYDLSFTRQGWLMMFNKPKLVAKTAARAYRMAANEKYFKYRELLRKTHPLYQEALRAGLEDTSLDRLSRHEEMFSSDIALKLPGIRPSARGYVGALNDLRFGFYYKTRESVEGMGLTAQQQKDLAIVANNLTGRGKVPDILKNVQKLGAPIFAMQLNAARIRSITDLASLKSPARRMLAGTLVKFIGVTLAALYLLDRKKGVSVEWNPKSSDFLKVRYKNTRVDITGGYQQLIRAVSQFATGKVKTTESKTEYDVERMEVITRFIQSKLSPHAGLALDLYRGKTFRGEQLRLEPGPIAEQVYQRITPLFIQDVIETSRFQGVGMASVIAPMAFHGVGVQTYEPSLSDDLRKSKNILAHQYFGKKWEDLGPDAQEAIKEYNPQLTIKEMEIKQKREDFDFIGKIIEESKDVSRKITKDLPKDVQAEFESLFIGIPGLSRNVGNGWYLNDKRYKIYQNDIRKMLKKYLSLIIRNPVYTSLDNDSKREILSDLIKEIKTKARMDLVANANFKDLEQLR